MVTKAPYKCFHKIHTQNIVEKSVNFSKITKTFLYIYFPSIATIKKNKKREKVQIQETFQFFPKTTTITNIYNSST